MEEKKQKVENEKKLSYEELKKVAGELSQQNQKMYQQILKMQEALRDRDFDYSSFFLSMLFKVMDHPEMYKDSFVSWASENIESALSAFAKAMDSGKEENPDASE